MGNITSWSSEGMSWEADNQFDWRHMEALRKAMAERFVAKTPDNDIISGLYSYQRRLLFTPITEFTNEGYAPGEFSSTGYVGWFNSYDIFLETLTRNTYVDLNTPGISIDITDSTIEEGLNGTSKYTATILFKYNNCVFYSTKKCFTKETTYDWMVNPPGSVNAIYYTTGSVIHTPLFSENFYTDGGGHRQRSVVGRVFSSFISFSDYLRLTYDNVYTEWHNVNQSDNSDFLIKGNSSTKYGQTPFSFLLLLCYGDLNTPLIQANKCGSRTQLKEWAIQRKLMLSKLKYQRTTLASKVPKIYLHQYLVTKYADASGEYPLTGL